MSLHRLAVLFWKDMRYGSRNVIFIFAVVLPVALSLAVSLLFGSLFSETPKLGIVDAGGDSALAAALSDADFLVVTQFNAESDLFAALQTGAVEAGLVLPTGFDAALRDGTARELTIHVWGQTLIRNRAILSAAISEQVLALSGRATPIDVEIVPLGDGVALSWQARLLPFVVLMSVVVGGVMVPASSMVDERQHRTLSAISITPLAMREIYLVKGFTGGVLALFSGFVTLSLNGGWGPQPLLLFGVLGLGATFAAAFGVFLGTMIKDVQTLFATIKGLGLILYAPGIIAVFPDLPQWLAQIFPTYYIMHPVMEISQNGAGLGDIAIELVVLAVLTALMIFGLGLTAERLQTQIAA